MTHHPHQLHAQAALYSLSAARRALLTRIAADARDFALEAGCTLRSPRYGVRHGSGGHSDPIGSALDVAVSRADRFDRVVKSTESTLAWLARKLDLDVHGDPLGYLLYAAPTLPPRTAAHLHRWVLEADHDIRKALHIGADRRPIVGVACPSCGLRQLEAQTSPTDRTLWTVICTSGEACTGEACTCGMPVRAAGVMHIWDSTSDLVKRHLGTVDA